MCIQVLLMQFETFLFADFNIFNIMLPTFKQF